MPSVHTLYGSYVPSADRTTAESNLLFRKACELAGTPPTQRQASKYRRGRGKAFPFRVLAAAELSKAGSK